MAAASKKPKPGFPKKEVAATRSMAKKIEAMKPTGKKAASKPAKKAAPKNIGYTPGAKGPKARTSNGVGQSRQARDYEDLLKKKSPSQIKGFLFGRGTS